MKEYCNDCGYFYETKCQCSEKKQQEREANYFARCLLMPADMVREEVKKMGGVSVMDNVKLYRLAQKFQVSDTLMALRIGELGL